MIPRRPLWLLLVLVLLLHGLALSGHWGGGGGADANASAPPLFQTRTVQAAPPAPAPAAQAAPAATPRPRPPRPPRPAPAKPRIPSDTIPTAPPPMVSTPPDGAELLAQAPTSDSTDTSDTSASAEAAPVPAPAAPASDAASAAVASADAATPPPAAADAAPAPVKLPPSTHLYFEVQGNAKGLQYHARAELRWQHDGSSYSASQEIKVLFLGARAQTSVGSITALGLQPRRFGDRSRSERAAHFDFAQGQVTFSANTPSAPIAPGAQDRLSVFLQLAGLLAAAPERYPPGTHLSITTVSARAADVWTFAVGSEENLDLPIGTLAAVPLTRLPRREFDQKAQVWLAPTLGYLPVRIRITEANGDFVDLRLHDQDAPPR